MPDLTPSADRYISAMLAREGRVPPEALDWVPEHERAELFHQYCLMHQADSGVCCEGGELVVGDVSTPAMPLEAVSPQRPPYDADASFEPITPQEPPIPVAPPSPSPVDQVLDYGSTKALLDSASAGRPIPKWAYLLPMIFGLLGGFVGWLAFKDENPRGARNVFVVGVAVTVLSFCFSVAVMGSLTPVLRSVSSASRTWPTTAQATARPALYYFGTST